MGLVGSRKAGSSSFTSTWVTTVTTSFLMPLFLSSPPMAFCRWYPMYPSLMAPHSGKGMDARMAPALAAVSSPRLIIPTWGPLPWTITTFLPLSTRSAMALAVFFAIFSKGPVGFLFPLLGCFVWLLSQRRLRDFGRAWGWRTWLVLVVLCGVWWGCVYLEGGRDYLHNLLVHQTVDRAVDAFHHKRPVYWYLYVVWYAMGPWSLLTIPVCVWSAVRKRLSELPRFFLVVSAAFFVLMSLFSSKLQIYLLPMFGFVDYACFLLLAAQENDLPRGGRTLRLACHILSGALLAAVLVAGCFFPLNF